MATICKMIKGRFSREPSMVSLFAAKIEWASTNKPKNENINFTLKPSDFILLIIKMLYIKRQ